MKALSVLRLVKSRASHPLSLRGRRAASADKPPHLEALEGRVLPSLTPHLVKDLNPSLASSHPVELVEVGGSAYFYANDGVHGYELWKSNGTAAGTTLVKDIRPGNRGSYFY